jgi:hypothetical protein
MTKSNKTKRNSKNSFKMTFKRWGTLAPQEHTREEDFYDYNDTPVKMGIFAFPEKLASYQDVSGPCFSNGRLQYVKDENGKKFMMTKKEFESIEWKSGKRYGFNCDIAVSPKYLRGLDDVYLGLECDSFSYHNYDDDDVCYSENNEDYMKAYAAWLDDEKRYPITKSTDKLRTFSYGGNIWHHLEFTNNWNHWMRTEDGIKADMHWAYYQKELDENYDLEGALNSIITGQYGEEYHFGNKVDRKIKRLVKPEDIICRRGSWILTDMRTYKKALEKAVHIAKYEKFMRMKAKGEVEGFPMGLPKREISPTLFEVYIEKVE